MSSIEEGSSLYYSLLWTPPATRQRFIDRLDLVRSLAGALDDVHEPQVAEHKIHWWHEELERMLTGASRHPAAQACQGSLPGPALPACLGILSASSTTRFTPPSTTAEADALLVQDQVARLALLAHALSDDVAELDLGSHPHNVARALGRHEQLSRLPYLVHRGQAVFSDETYRQFGLQPADLAARVRVAEDARQPEGSTLGSIPVVVEKPDRQELLCDRVAAATAEARQALADPLVSRRYRQAPLLPLWRLLVLREKQLSLWQEKQPDLLRERLVLTPLTKFYWAWRHRR